MVRITEDLVRKRAEHNESEICSLEEISLHQQDIEKIEYLDKWCRELRILYLQSNLIGKIENVSRLKKLQYLNLALNNIEKVENLEGCESLEKLDLTVNFIGEIYSLLSLQQLPHLHELYLTGNPCSQFTSYRQFVVCCLPQLQTLDGEDITRSERITAQQNWRFIQEETQREQENWLKQREIEKLEAADRQKKREEAKAAGLEVDEDYFQEKVAYTPESRLETHEYMQEKRKKENPEPEPVKKRDHPLFFPDGRPYNVNEAKIDFSLTDEEEENAFVLDVAVFKHMDTSLIECDVQPQYIRVTVKGKVLQLSLPAEVLADASIAQRSATTGHLIVRMPKAAACIVPPKAKHHHHQQQQEPAKEQKSGREFLEVDASARTGVGVDAISNLTSSQQQQQNDGVNGRPLGMQRWKLGDRQERNNSEDFVDDPDVPPLL